MFQIDHFLNVNSIYSRGAGLRPDPRSLLCTGTRCWQGLVQGVTGFGTRCDKVNYGTRRDMVIY